MSTYEHIIFDFDGVISDSFGAACEEFNKLAEKRFPMLPKVKTKEDFAFVYSGPLKTSLRRFGLTDDQCAAFFDAHSSAMQERQDIAPFWDVLDAICNSLVDKCSIVTSSYSLAVETVLHKYPAFRNGIFRHISGREQKLPKSRKILSILEHSRISKDHVIYVGDMVSDILYCRDVPIQVAVVGYGYHPVNYLRVFNPDICLTTTTELTEFIRDVA